MGRLLAAPVVASIASVAHAAPDVSGNWIIEDRSAVISIERCASGLCGRIAKGLIFKPNYAKTDVHNPNPALRNRPMLGLQILSGFTERSDRWEGGRIYDPESGKSYKSSLGLNADGSLKVSGCVLVFCRSQRWTRN